MLKRDFILVQIEELTKVVLQIIMNRGPPYTGVDPNHIQFPQTGPSHPYDGPARRTYPPARQ